MAGRPRSTAIDRALREAALATFVARGLSDFTFDEVARRAGVSRTAIYRRWSSHTALLLDALQTWRETYGDLRGDQTRPLPELIASLTVTAAEAIRDPFARALLVRLLTVGPEGRDMLESYFSRTITLQRAALTDAIVQAQRRGGVAADIDPAVALDAVAGALVYTLLSGQADAPDFDAQEYIEKLFHMVGLVTKR